MSERRPYTYVVLRYRHDPISGEQANVGVVVHSVAGRFLGARIRRSAGRLSKLFPDMNGRAFRSDMRAIDRAFARVTKAEQASLLSHDLDAASLARQVVRDDDGSLVWGDLGSGVSNDLNGTLQTLYERLVTRYDDVTEKRKTDEDVWRPVRAKLVEREIAARLGPKTIRSEHIELEFVHAWKNGAWHCIQPLSFDLATADGIQEKASRWAGHLVGLSKAQEPFVPYFVVGRPCSRGLVPAFDRAIGLLGDAPGSIEIIREDEIDEFVDRLEDEIRSHDATRQT